MGLSMSDLLQPMRFRMEMERSSREQRKFAAEQARLARQEESKQNNQMMDRFWKAATDENTPRALFENMKGMADKLASTMTWQERAGLDTIIARGLFSETDKKRDEFRRIKGPRPAAEFESITLENLAQAANARVAQVKWDTQQKVYLAGGKDKLGEENMPGLIPITRMEGKDGAMHDIYAYENPATGLVGTIDTVVDIPGDMWNKAKESGFGPTMMARWDFVPLPGDKGRLITSGDQQYMMHSGVRLSTGEQRTIKMPVGPAPDKTRVRSESPPSRALDTVDWINNVVSGSIEEEKAGKYISWVKQAKDLANTKIPKENYEGDFPLIKGEYGAKFLNLQRKFSASNPGWCIAPIGIGHKEAAGIYPDDYWVDNYYAENAEYILFPSDGERVLIVDGEAEKMHYKEYLEGEKHVWLDSYGQRQPFTGAAPNTKVTTEK